MNEQFKVRTNQWFINIFDLLSIPILLFFGALLLSGCSSEDEKSEAMDNTKKNVSEKLFGTLEDGREVHLYTLSNDQVEVDITNYGGIITAIRVPNQDGKKENVVLGFDSLKKYVAGHPYFGAIIGRYGNRIEDGKFSINSKQYTLATNDGNNHLHGGESGFDKKVWQVLSTDTSSLELRYLSKDDEEGYPGNLDVTVTYSLTNENAIKIEYRATTDKPTPVNLTNHSYFNLSGHPDSTILDHQLMINADQYTPVDDGLIPTGELKPVDQSPFNFTEFRRIGSRIDEVAGGYDHNFVLNNSASDSMFHAATVYSPASGREMKVFTTEPGLQFYSGNFLDGSLQGPDGAKFIKHAAFCLETQHFPNSPNEPAFPSTIIQTGKEYQSTTVYQFSTR